MNAVLYIHGKGGDAAESAFYEPLFPGRRVIGLDYKTFTPWETGVEIRVAVDELKKNYESVTLIANSVGAFFSMCSGIDVKKAYFISPVVDMEKLIGAMMLRANVTEDELRRRGAIPTSFGEDLSWEYLTYVRTHPTEWNAPTSILFGERDELTSYETVSDFAKKCGAALTVMKNGEHWFHTDEQLAFLKEWILNEENTLETKRLILRPWRGSDAPELFRYASDPDVGPNAGWPAHTSVEESARIIRDVLEKPESFAIVSKETGLAIGCVGMKFGEATDLTDREDECEFGYWLGKPYWGRALMPEAVKALLRRAFEDIGVSKVWCGYYDGNLKSKRVQEKCGFRYHHTTEGLYVALMDEYRTGHANCLTKEQWMKG